MYNAISCGYAGRTTLPRYLRSCGSSSAPRCRLTVLGSGTLVSFGQRRPAGYVLETNTSLTLFDCNSHSLLSFRQYGFDPTKLNAIYIGHDHSDHSLGLVEWLEVIATQCAMQGTQPQLPNIVGPVGLVQGLANDIARHIPAKRDLFGKSLGWYSVTEVSPDGFLESRVGDLRIVTYPTVHDDNLPGSLGFRITWRDKVIAYPNDFGSLQMAEELLPRIRDAELLILDAGSPGLGSPGHLHILEAIELKDRANARLLLASHIPDFPGRVEAVREYITKAGREDDVIVAEDGMYFDF